MPKTLALIHTSMVFLTVETIMQDILAQVLPDVRLINIVDDSLLPDVMAAGAISPAVTRRMCAYIVAAEVAGADAALSLCSSLGPTVDVARELVSIPVVKIDDAMTEKAACEADRIGVMATVGTTLRPTVDLIEEKAAVMDKPVQVYQSLVKGAFEALMSGDKDKHLGRRPGPGQQSRDAGTCPGIYDPVGTAPATRDPAAGADQSETGHRIYPARVGRTGLVGRGGNSLIPEAGTDSLSTA